MKEYENLTNRGKLKRLRRLAETALEAYGLEDSVLTFLCRQTNFIYRVRTGTGENYVMRLASPGWRTRANLVNEALWLKALEKDPHISAPRIIPTRNGTYVPSFSCPGIPHDWNVSLFSELPGRLLEFSLTAKNLRKAGELTARLHIHGKAWQRPAEFSEQIFDHYLSRGEEDALFSRENLVRLTRETCELLYGIRDIAEGEYGRLDRDDLRVIHCDLWHGNIRVHRGNLYPFDFEDIIIGFRLHDVAMALLDLKEDSGADYPRLLDAYREGYESLLSWPEGSLVALQAGRILWRLNWILRFMPSGFGKALEGSLGFFRSLPGE